MAKKSKGSKIPWTPILVVGAIGVAYWQKDKIITFYDQHIHPLITGGAKSSYANVIPYFNITPGVGQGRRGSAYQPYAESQVFPWSRARGGAFYPYHRTHYSV